LAPTHSISPILDSRKLLTFVTLARVGSFTLTAHELDITQSAVSHAIKSLETEVGCRLFDRLGRRIALTPAGRLLLEHAGKILAEMQSAYASLAALSRPAAVS
jgi:DNA-binding transcriptional LysR family regulator